MLPNPAVIAGTFDPPTMGHVDLIRRTSYIFTHVYVIIANNLAKRETMFNAAERLELMEKILFEYDLINVRAKIMKQGSLLVDECSALGSKVLVRGIRDGIDLTYETQLAAVNRSQNPEIDTIYMVTHPSLAHVSSSSAKEVGKLGGKLFSYVPGPVLEAMQKRFAKA